MINPVSRASILLASINQQILTTAIRFLTHKDDDVFAIRLGGVLAIAVVYPDRNFAEFQSVSIGLPGLKFGRFARNTAEKVARLFERRAEGNDEVAASVSADDTLGTYGGCIFFRSRLAGCHEEIYVSFSGAPPEVDEALAFVIGEQLGLETPKYENPLIPRARELLEDLIRG